MTPGPNKELEDLFERPLVRALFDGKTHILAEGFTIEDVLLELYQFGDVTLTTIETNRALDGKAWPWILCTVLPHGPDTKESSATGQTATAAALRCLIGLLSRFDRLASLTTSRLETFMEGTGDLSDEAQEGIDQLIEFLRKQEPQE